METRHAFVGDQSGQVTILKLEQDSCSLVTTFKGHTGAAHATAQPKPASYGMETVACVLDDESDSSQGTVAEIYATSDCFRALALIALQETCIDVLQDVLQLHEESQKDSFFSYYALIVAGILSP